MELLPEELRKQLPRIRGLDSPPLDAYRMIYARLFTEHTGVSFYVAEGQPGEDPEYLLWGLLIAPQYKFPLRLLIRLSQIEGSDWLGGEPCRRDENFVPARWELVERNIGNLHPPL